MKERFYDFFSRFTRNFSTFKMLNKIYTKIKNIDTQQKK